MAYSVHDTFPEEELVAAAHIEDTSLLEALKALNDAKAELEVRSNSISHGKCVAKARANGTHADGDPRYKSGDDARRRIMDDERESCSTRY